MDFMRISRTVFVSALAVFGTSLATDAAAQGATQVAARGTPAAANLAPPSYYSAVQGVLEGNCVTCHTENPVSVGGMIAPFALTTYEDARRRAGSIARAVAADYMPPWDADIQHQGTFKNERYLSDADKQVLVDWAEAGAPMGDPSEAPAAASFAAVQVQEPTVAPDGRVWLMGIPDLVVGFDEPLLVCEEVEDWQPQVPQRVISGDLGQPRWIRGTEINAGPKVHHTVSSLLGVGTPGRGPFEFPEGWGLLMVPDQYMSISMHYHKEVGPGTEVIDDTRGGVQFYEDGTRIDHVVETRLQPYNDFVIPAGHPYYPVENVTHFDEDIYLLSMGPHAHYRGTAVRVEIQRPDRQFRETLLWVPDYDFNWQFQYELQEPILIPAGSSMITTWYYDNSNGNPYNPDPTVDVTYGAATTDEMSNSRIYFARTQPLGLVAGGPIPTEILERAHAADDRARRFAREWEDGSQSCANAAPGVASR
jgi:mono/diheme cytochrome c family protein